MQNGFIMDDYRLLLDENNLSTYSLGKLFSEGSTRHYRPVGIGFVKLELLLFQENKFLYHLTNLVLFWGICFLFFVLIRKILTNTSLAALASFLYAAHPVHNNLINYKTSSPLNLYILFLQISILFFCRYLNRKNNLIYLSSLFFYFLGLLSHDIAFILPVFIFLILQFTNEKSWKIKIGYGNRACNRAIPFDPRI